MNEVIIEIILRIQALEPQTKEIVLRYLDLLQQAQEISQAFPEVQEIDY